MNKRYNLRERLEEFTGAKVSDIELSSSSGDNEYQPKFKRVNLDEGLFSSTSESEIDRSNSKSSGLDEPMR